MPRKVRELKAMLRKAGFTCRPGKGSHTVWDHAFLFGRPIVLAGNDGKNARRYQEERVIAAIRHVENQS